MKKSIGIIVCIIIVLGIAGAATWLFMSGKLVWAGTGSTVTVTKAVCGTDIVNKYNDAMQMMIRDGSTEATIDAQGVKDVTATIKQQNGYQNDATCQTLLFWIAIYNNDYASAKSSYAVVQKLHDEGIFADNNIRGNDALLTYQSVLFPLSPEASNKQKADTSAP